MGTPVVILPSGGIAVTESPNGIPLTEATNGRGFAVTFVASGGLPVIGITSGPDVTAPIITSSNAISQPENSILNHVLAANETVTWAKVGGADTAKFTLVGNTLTLPAKDFENPDDAGLNNTYIVQVQATDTASNVSLVQTITVTITDVVEAGPTAPVLAMDPAWTTTDATPDFTIDIDDTIGAGDDLRLQIQVAGGDWSSPVDDTTHTITAPEDAANEIALASGSLSNASYEARARVDDGTPSAWSNVVSFTVAAVATGYGLLWGTDAIMWDTDYMTWEAPAYQGPGDVVAGSWLSWGSSARAFSAAYAASAGPLMDIRNAGGTTTTINCLTTGFCDVATLAAWITTNGAASVSKLYDQTGNGRHLTNATFASMPTITQSALNGLPGMTSVGASNTVLTSLATLTQNQPFGFTGVAKRTAAFTTSQTFIAAQTAAISSGWGVVANTMDLAAGTAVTRTATDNVFHAANGTLNGATSGHNVDGSDSGNAAGGASVFTAANLRLFRNNGGTTMTGIVMEAGMRGADITAAERTALNTNQHHATYGYNF